MAFIFDHEIRVMLRVILVSLLNELCCLASLTEQFEIV